MALADIAMGVNDAFQRQILRRVQAEQARDLAARQAAQDQRAQEQIDLQRSSQEFTQGRLTAGDAEKTAAAEQRKFYLNTLPPNARRVLEAQQHGLTGVTEHTFEEDGAHQAHLDAEAQRERDTKFNDWKRQQDYGENLLRTRPDKTKPTEPAGPSPYALETASRTIAAINEVLPKIGHATAGIGSVLSSIPGTPAANVSAELSSVVSNVAFQALQAMREASKTGGALGPISERELDLLSAVEGSIRQNQSPENLRKNLVLIKESMTRFKNAAALASPGRTGGGAGGGSNRVDELLQKYGGL